ncbi:hypothetical protein M427DRAFT_28126 [Gonapodya prolifera JEL478]|uniref:Pentacotripeptide-repeat region of PRORP domain-containing protein n=1 Tax=Gonapodya prolifera (strain JEL478) TaxID=1344416 RepID=A0A139AV84_GONPJ|nr:hypothetical protein M427DRAFT_28126 [Gonapodya prolifera JEL478]|eukprot:KXS20395.1 hypothetical protein M427DRAFT_28126 [Gonapodya prolifera JEL478]
MRPVHSVTETPGRLRSARSTVDMVSVSDGNLQDRRLVLSIEQPMRGPRHHHRTWIRFFRETRETSGEIGLGGRKHWTTNSGHRRWTGSTRTRKNNGTDANGEIQDAVLRAEVYSVGKVELLAFGGCFGHSATTTHFLPTSAIAATMSVLRVELRCHANKDTLGRILGTQSTQAVSSPGNAYGCCSVTVWDFLAPAAASVAARPRNGHAAVALRGFSRGLLGTGNVSHHSARHTHTVAATHDDTHARTDTPTPASVALLSHVTPQAELRRRPSKSRLDTSLVAPSVSALEAAARTIDPALTWVAYAVTAHSDEARLLTHGHRTAALAAALKHPDPRAGAAAARQVIRDGKNAQRILQERLDGLAQAADGDATDDRPPHPLPARRLVGPDHRDYYLAMRAELRAGNSRGVRALWDDLVADDGPGSTGSGSGSGSGRDGVVQPTQTQPQSRTLLLPASLLPHRKCLLAAYVDLVDVHAGERAFKDIVLEEANRQRVPRVATGKKEKSKEKLPTTYHYLSATLPRLHLDPEVPALLLSLYARASMPHESLALFDDLVQRRWGPAPDRRAYEALAACLGEAGVGAGGGSATSRAPGTAPAPAPYPTGIPAARAVVRAMTDAGLRPGAETVEALVGVCEHVAAGGGAGASEAWRVAEHYVTYLRDMAGAIAVTPAIWAVLIRMAARGAGAGAGAGSEDSGGAAGGAGGSGAAAASLYAVATPGEPALRRADAMFRGMPAQGALPDRACYEALVLALDERGGGAEWADRRVVELVDEMVRKGVPRSWRVDEAAVRAGERLGATGGGGGW